jgi:hypothetical protein
MGDKELENIPNERDDLDDADIEGEGEVEPQE